MEDRVRELEAALSALTIRVAALEARDARPAELPSAVPHAPLPAPSAAAPPLPLAALLGRTCLVLGGAFLIRALTEGGTLPRPLGVAAGLAYALAWLLLALRRGLRPFDATLHGLTALVVADPLLFETAARLGVLSPRDTLLALAGVTLLALGVAAARKLSVLAWGAALGALGTALALFFESYDVLGTASFLLAAGLAAWGTAEARGWHGLRWPLLAAADLLVLEGGFLLSRPGGPPEAYGVLDRLAFSSCGVALAFATLGATLLLTLVRKKEADLFTQLQTLAALAVGLGSAIRVSEGPEASGLGAFVLLTGGGAYAIAFAFVERDSARGTTFRFFASLAILTTLAGTAVLFPARGLPAIWSFLALGAALAGGRFDRVTLRTHAALYAVAAALASGFVSAAGEAWTSPRAGAGLSGAAIGVLGVLVVLWGVLFSAQRRPDLPAAARVPRFAVAVLALAGLGALATLGLARLFGGAAPPPAALAVSRTIVLALSALLLAEAGRRAPLRELSWLVWPILACGGLKLLLEDLRVGRPATLFPAFVVYGVALWVAPRVAKRPLTPAGAPAAAGPAPS